MINFDTTNIIPANMLRMLLLLLAPKQDTKPISTLLIVLMPALSLDPNRTSDKRIKPIMIHKMPQIRRHHHNQMATVE